MPWLWPHQTWQSHMIVSHIYFAEFCLLLLSSTLQVPPVQLKLNFFTPQWTFSRYAGHIPSTITDKVFFSNFVSLIWGWFMLIFTVQICFCWTRISVPCTAVCSQSHLGRNYVCREYVAFVLCSQSNCRSDCLSQGPSSSAWCYYGSLTKTRQSLQLYSRFQTCQIYIR